MEEGGFGINGFFILLLYHKMQMTLSSNGVLNYLSHRSSINLGDWKFSDAFFMDL